MRIFVRYLRLSYSTFSHAGGHLAEIEGRGERIAKEIHCDLRSVFTASTAVNTCFETCCRSCFSNFHKLLAVYLKIYF